MLALTTQIVASYISKNATQGTDLPVLIDRVFQSLAGIATGSAAAPEAPLTPAVPVKKSVFPDHIVCLEDGKKLKMLKRNLMTSYGLTPDAYIDILRLNRTACGGFPTVLPARPCAAYVAGVDP